MKLLNIEAVLPAGELYERTALLARRLSDSCYLAGEGGVFDAPTRDWAADWIGRALLAQVMVSRSIKEECGEPDAIVAALPEHFNERGYLGEILPDGHFDEQQLSGHSWLLRGLCEYYAWKADEKVKAMVSRIVERLYLPALQSYPSYPIEGRAEGGAMSGTIAQSSGAWRLSTDTACAFIALDGLTAAYELIGGEGLKGLIEAMIKRFFEIDLLDVKAQTHATLTALRGIMRYGDLSGDGSLYNGCEKVFALYREHGMTACYQNYNWFGRPEWTEPCAVVDSFIVAMRLYFHTNRSDYIDLAQRILYNGIGRGQRPNGGFGCDSCAVDGIVKNHCYEASWCCTMRGGEGLAEAARFSCVVEGNYIMLPYLTSAEYSLDIDDEHIGMTITTRYPFEGRADVDITGVTSRGKLTLLVYRPRENEFYNVPLTPDNSHIELKFLIPLIAAAPASEQEGIVYMHGNLVLGANPNETPDFSRISARGEGVYYAGTAKLAPVLNLWKLPKAKAEADEKRIIF